MARTHDDARDNPQPGDRYNYPTMPHAYDEVLEVLADGSLTIRRHRKDSTTDTTLALDDWNFGARIECWVPA